MQDGFWRKRMNMKNIALAAALTLASAGAANAAGWHGDMAGGPHGGYMELLRGVTLTDAQKTQMHAIMKSGWASARPTMEQMHAIHEQIATLLTSSGSVAKDQVNALVRQEDRLRLQMDEARMGQFLAIRNLLTSEQLAQAASTHQQMEALHAQEHALMAPPAEAQ
jgi:Spy/CpxP family protein refolding chaperone